MVTITVAIPTDQQLWQRVNCLTFMLETEAYFVTFNYTWAIRTWGSNSAGDTWGFVFSQMWLSRFLSCGMRGRDVWYQCLGRTRCFHIVLLNVNIYQFTRRHVQEHWDFQHYWTTEAESEFCPELVLEECAIWIEHILLFNIKHDDGVKPTFNFRH